MAYVDIDLTTEGYSPIPASTYRVRIDDSIVESSKSDKNFGKPLVKFTFTVLSPERIKDPLTGEMVETGGKKLTRRLPAWAGAGGFLADLVRAAGGSLTSLGFDTKDLHGVELMAVVNTRVYNDQLTNDIERFYPVSAKSRNAAPPPPPLNDDDAPF